MNRREYHLTAKVVHSIPIALVVGLAFFAGCATSPSPEVLARVERARVERQARADARDAQRREAEERQRQQQAEKRRILLSRQNEVQSNSAGIQPTPESVSRANVLLVRLNATAGKSLQTDSRGFSSLFKTSEIQTNTPPIFLLDVATGRLVLRLTPTETRALMLRHVQNVRTFVNKSNFKIQDNPEITNIRYEVWVTMEANDKVTYVSSSGKNSWKDGITVLADDNASATLIEASLQELVSIYKE